jgi:signal peptidase II
MTASLDTSSPLELTAPHHRKLGYGLAATLFVADQLLKWVMIGPLNLQTVREIYIMPIFQFTWVENRGMALGLFAAYDDTVRWVLVAVTAGIAAFVAHWMWRERRRGDVWGLGLILGGALGNIVDRVRFGYVVDFLDLHFGEFRPFLVFNLADAAITIGVVILLYRALTEREPTVETEKS